MSQATMNSSSRFLMGNESKVIFVTDKIML